MQSIFMGYGGSVSGSPFTGPSITDTESGSAEWTTPGSYTWVCHSVYWVSSVCIGGGGHGGTSNAESVAVRWWSWLEKIYCSYQGNHMM